MTRHRPTDDDDQTSIVSHAAAGCLPATVGGDIVATHAELQRTENANETV